MQDPASDFETDSESGDERPGSPTRLADKDVLEDHDEAERLLSAVSSAPRVKPRFDSVPYGDTSTGLRRLRSKRYQRGRRRSSASVNDSNNVYEMEEGYKDISSSSSVDSLILDHKQWQNAPIRAGFPFRIAVISSSIVAFLMLIMFGAYRVSHSQSIYKAKTYSNGTHVFEATTILISLDGFRADFLQRGITPSLNAFVQSGVSPSYMLPSFPSVTFPNHYTLVTGLYPESHGIVGNQFWDPEFQEEFYYTKTSVSMLSKWWSAAEPIWVTAEKQGIKTGVHMWPGSEAHIQGIDPTYLDTFNAHEQLPRKVDRILELLDTDKEDRPQLIAAYVPDVDRDGHKFGPNSTEIRATIAKTDNMMTLLIEGLLQRNLTEIVNLVVVSDHGMATMSVHRMVQLDDLVDMDLIDHIDGWPLRGLRLKNPDRDLQKMYAQLSEAAQKAGTFDVYTLENMPARYHFSNNRRIAPLWIVPKTGWMVIEREDFDIAAAIAEGREFHPRGIHGFDHEHPLMRAIFIARGPAFPHAPNSKVPVFQNIEVYNIVCDSLGITPHGNNGTVRLPMKTEGLHSDLDGAALELPKDDPADVDEEGLPSEVAKTDETNVEEGSASGQGEDEGKNKWWKYLHDQLQKAKDWAKEVIDSITKNKEGSRPTAE